MNISSINYFDTIQNVHTTRKNLIDLIKMLLNVLLVNSNYIITTEINVFQFYPIHLILACTFNQKE